VNAVNRKARYLAFIGAVICAAVEVPYTDWMLHGGGGEYTYREPFIASFLGFIAVMAAAGAVFVQQRHLASYLLMFSATGSLALGVVGIFSIGLPLILAAIPLIVAAGLSSQHLGHRLVAPAAIASALLVLLAGLAATELPYGCPQSGFSGGSGRVLFAVPYQWTCVNGKLTVSGRECTEGSAVIDVHGHVVSSSGC